MSTYRLPKNYEADPGSFVGESKSIVLVVKGMQTYYQRINTSHEHQTHTTTLYVDPKVMRSLPRKGEGVIYSPSAAVLVTSNSESSLCAFFARVGSAWRAELARLTG